MAPKGARGWIMVKAYLKINVAPGKERSAKEALLKVGGVKSADLTTGEQDIIVLVEEETYDDILSLVLNELRGIDGIEGTITNLVTE